MSKINEQSRNRLRDTKKRLTVIRADQVWVRCERVKGLSKNKNTLI